MANVLSLNSLNRDLHLWLSVSGSCLASKYVWRTRNHKTVNPLEINSENPHSRQIMGVKILGGRGQVRTTDTDSCDEVNWWNAWINFYSIINDFMTWTRFPNFKHRPKLQDLATRWVWRSRNTKNAIWFLPTVSCQNFSSSGLHLLVFIVFYLDAALGWLLLGYYKVAASDGFFATALLGIVADTLNEIYLVSKLSPILVFVGWHCGWCCGKVAWLR